MFRPDEAMLKTWMKVGLHLKYFLFMRTSENFSQLITDFHVLTDFSGKIGCFIMDACDIILGLPGNSSLKWDQFNNGT